MLKLETAFTLNHTSLYAEFEFDFKSTENLKLT